MEYKGHCFPNGLTEAERYVKYDGLKDFFRKTYKLMEGIVQIRDLTSSARMDSR